MWYCLVSVLWTFISPSSCASVKSWQTNDAFIDNSGNHLNCSFFLFILGQSVGTVPSSGHFFFGFCTCYTKRIARYLQKKLVNVNIVSLGCGELGQIIWSLVYILYVKSKLSGNIYSEISNLIIFATSMWVSWFSFALESETFYKKKSSYLIKSKSK